MCVYEIVGLGYLMLLASNYCVPLSRNHDLHLLMYTDVPSFGRAALRFLPYSLELGNNMSSKVRLQFSGDGKDIQSSCPVHDASVVSEPPR